jgi:uncharacterized membrane protein HdeD (DUF308 family)
MLADTLQQAFRRTWWALVIRGLLAVALGIFILVKPLDSVAAFALVIAIWALVAGITEIVHSIDIRPFFGSWWVLLLGGLISAGFGVAALYYYPDLSLAFAVAWVSFWLLLSGILGITVAVQEKRAGLPWGWVFTWGIVSVAVSIAALVSPPATLAAIMGLMAGFAIASGVVLLIGAFRLKSLENEVTQSVRHASQARSPKPLTPVPDR